LSPLSGTRKIALPPLPWIGLITTAPCRPMNSRTSATLRVTALGGFKLCGFDREWRIPARQITLNSA